MLCAELGRRDVKRCQFCAEEIQDAAIVCKHCGRDLVTQAASPVAPAPRKKPGAAKLLLGIVGIIIVLAWVGNQFDSERLLNISGAKGALSLSITNREDSDLRDCKLSVTDSDKVVWVASIEKDVAPLETVSVAWSEFKSENDQPMPAYLGKRGVIVNCDVMGLKQRLGAGLR